MAITMKSVEVLKNKTKATAKHEETGKAQIDALAEWNERLKNLKQAYETEKRDFDKEVSDLVELVETTQHLSPEDSTYLKGLHYEQQIGPMAQVSEVDAEKAFALLKKIDKALPLKLVKFGVTDLRAYLTPAQFEQVVTVERTGRRRVSFKKAE